MFLSRELITVWHDSEKKVVSVPEWGGEVLLRTMSSRHLDAIRDVFDVEGLKNKDTPQTIETMVRIQVQLISYCLAAEDGVLLFDDDEGREILAQRDRDVIDRLFDIAMHINKLTKEAEEQEKKALQMTPSNGSDSLSASQ